MMPMRIEDAFVETLKVDAEIQARVAINDEVVEEYAAAMSDGMKDWPPIVIFREEGVGDWVADGFHRVLAARRAGIPTLQATVYGGTRQDAMWFAAGANQRHGLRRTAADKRKAVEMALALNPTASDGVLAEHVGVSRRLVLDVRARLLGVGSADAKQRVGADGKAYKLPSRPPSAAPRSPEDACTESAQAVQPCPDMSSAGVSDLSHQVVQSYNLSPDEPVAIEIPEEGVPPARATAPPPKPAAPEILDATGRPVPPEAQPLWGRRKEVQELLSMLSRIRGAVRRYEETKDPICAQAPINSLHAVLDKAYTLLELLKPYAVCPSCAGLIGCRLCSGTGLLNKFRWDTAVSKDQKRAMGLA